MKRITKAAKRITELEQAIVACNEWCLAVEGVRLTYFFQGPEDEESSKIINEIIGNAVMRPDNGKTRTTN
jgi:hypothetical protein